MPATTSEPTATTQSTWSPPEPTLWRPGRITLAVADGHGEEQQIILEPSGRIVVGRSRSADLVLNHPSVSGAHFDLRLNSSGIELRDLDSTNGTWLGQTRVYHAAVSPGAAITAGECTLSLFSVENVEVPLFRGIRLAARGESPNLAAITTQSGNHALRDLEPRDRKSKQ